MKYVENPLDLETRIRAHKLFSRATLESVVEDTLAGLNDFSVLDLGCGNGNYFELLSRSAKTYVGVDVNQGLLNEFANKNHASKRILIRASMDHLPEFMGSSFDAIYSIYSIYYTEQPSVLVPLLHSVLTDKGQLVVMGPGKSTHAPEVSHFLLAVQNHIESSTDDHLAKNKQLRIGTFHHEIIPNIERIFRATNVSEINTSLVFPDSLEWAKYVASTPEVREGFPELERDELVSIAQQYSEATGCHTVSKAVQCLVARK